MATDPVYADIQELYDRFAAADIVRFADDTGVLDTTGDGPAQVKTAYGGGSPSGTTEEKEAANEAADTVTDALRDAEAEVNGYLQSSYDVPVASTASETPRIIRRVTCDLAHHRLHPDPTDAAQDGREDAIDTLEKIAKGMIELGIQVDGSDSPTGGSRTSATQGSETFASGELDPWARGDNYVGR